MPVFSPSVQLLWAKTDDVQYLYQHMAKSADKAHAIWRNWLSFGARAGLSRTLGGEFAEKLFVFLAYVHDIGKATPAFQFQENLPFRSCAHVLEELTERLRSAGFQEARMEGAEYKSARHELASYAILLRQGVHESVAVVAGGHHGSPPSNQQAEDIARGSRHRVFGFRKEKWREAQNELFMQGLTHAGITRDEICAVRLTICEQMLLSGLVILADWLASAREDIALPERWEARGAWTDFGMSVFSEHIGHSLNAMQATAAEAALGVNKPGIAIIEAAMGTGKTEAALILAEVFAHKAGQSGVYFALPTRATADGILERFANWIKKVSGAEPHAILLAHGKARFHKAYSALARVEVCCDTEGVNDGVYVHEWFTGRKKQLLADFAVGTIDQLLMGALRHKHIALRHVGLANKVVIIDEVHAYDAYMDTYLYRVLRWLGEYGVPVIVLSATLPCDTRQRLIEAYLSAMPVICPKSWATSRAYPLITYTDGASLKQASAQSGRNTPLRVAMERYDGDIGDKLDELLKGGGCAGVIVNTVKRAQEVARALEARFSEAEVLLLHARFTAADRAWHEENLLRMLGPPSIAKRPEKLIVVGTQVIEQSLDIDFDVMMSDCCPMDLLLQRVGRLFRHERRRPKSLSKPVCFVMNADEPDKGSLAIYDEYTLLCTRFLLPDEIALPEDIPHLVQTAYADMPVPEGYEKKFAAAKAEYIERIKEKERQACTFRLEAPSERAKPVLVGWLDYADPKATGRQGEASVRDGDQALEVLLLMRDEEGFRLLPWIEGGRRIRHDQMPEYEIACALAGCSVALPRALAAHYTLDDTIRALDTLRKSDMPSSWDDSHWLRGALYLPLNEQLETQLLGYKVKYSRKWGLEVTKLEHK